jgi:hypothetical protein
LGIRLNDQLLQSSKGCYGDMRFTERILKSLPGIDVEGTLRLFREYGGHCDCHILHNFIGINQIIKTAKPSGY